MSSPVAAAYPGLTDLLNRADAGTMPLPAFLAEVRRNACDGGQLMDQAVDEMLTEFRRTVEAAFDDRARELGDALAKEQVALLLRHRTGEQRMISRAQILLDHLRELMPSFQYDQYAIDPDGYVRKALAAGTCGPEANDNAGPPPEDDDDQEGSGARRQKMTSALNWLRSEVTRADCENAALGKRYDAAVASVAAAGSRLLAEQCRAKELKAAARAELDGLRQKSAKQVALIDGYVEKIGLLSRVGPGPNAC